MLLILKEVLRKKKINSYVVEEKGFFSIFSALELILVCFDLRISQ